MAPKTLLLALGAANLAAAHFGLAYPSWRADTLKGTNETGYSQWLYPCTFPHPAPTHSPISSHASPPIKMRFHRSPRS